MAELDLSKSHEMFARAEKLVPNGIFGPRNPNFMVPGQYPCFYREGNMGHAIDVDGNEYVDFMCSFGANLLGYRHPKVDEAVREQMSRGGLMTMPMDRWVELAEYLTDNTPLADWVIFAKNGSDVTTWCTNAARVHTKKKKILMASGSYHGFHSWCVPITTGVPNEHHSGVVNFEYNNIKSLQKAVDKYKDELAAIILTPMRHEVFSDIELPVDGFYDEVRKLCDEHNIVFILDDIRCCYRLQFEGSSEYFGAKPDLVTIGKGMANGYPISVAYGTEKMFPAAKQVYFSGTHFYSAQPMAAALCTLEIIRTEGVIDKVRELGEKLRDGMIEVAESNGQKIKWSGPPAIPFMTIEGDSGFQWSRAFCGEMIKRGIFLHPHHNWFICAGHTEDDINKTVEAADAGFKVVKGLQ